jgi:hypothetical protein
MKDRESSTLPMGRYTEPECQRKIIIQHDAIPHQTETNVNNRILTFERLTDNFLNTHQFHGSPRPNRIVHILPYSTA